MRTIARCLARCLAAAGIALSGVALSAAPASAGGGCHGPLTDAAGVHVEIADLCFTPTVIRVRPGVTVNWVNRGGIEHTVTATGDAFDADLQDGQAYSRRFDQSGVFTYYCRFHPGMVGAVVVGDGRPAAGAADAAATTIAALTAAGPAAAGPAARSSHRSVGPDLGIGALVVVAAALSLGGWRAAQMRRPKAATTS